jgi:hypothetical protein
MSNNLTILKDLLASGQFHHATYRCQGSLWEGLWIYRRSDNGFRGYEPATTFLKSDPSLELAHELVRSTGISLGSYGQG